MVDWQVTATTIYCDAVDDDITIMVYRDGTVRCVGHKKYAEGITKETAKALKQRAKKLGRELRCEGSECPRMMAYREKVFAEETDAKEASRLKFGR